MKKIRQSFNDVVSLTNFGFQLNATIIYKKWVLTADGTYANLGSNLDQGLLIVDLDIKQYMLDLKLGYLIYSDIEIGDEKSVIRGWALEADAGAKYWKNDITVNYKVQIGDPPVEGGFKEPQGIEHLNTPVKMEKVTIN